MYIKEVESYVKGPWGRKKRKESQLWIKFIIIITIYVSIFLKHIDHNMPNSVKFIGVCKEVK